MESISLHTSIHFYAILRDPVPRLFSNYFHRLKCCLDGIAFEQWVETQISEMDTCLQV